MEQISYSAHISNKKSAINSKAKLAGVAKHNLRKYHSSDYSQEHVILIYGTDNLMNDVKRVYREEFEQSLKEYNERQTREDRKIKDYFEHVAEKQQDIAVEIIIQVGDKEFWEENWSRRKDAEYVYEDILYYLQKYLPDFVVANAVIHYDEASPHMHVVGVPVGRNFKRGLSTKVSKRSVFTQETLSNILQGELREIAETCAFRHLNKVFKEKKKGKNHDLSVMEYKVAKESEKLEHISEDVFLRENNLDELKDSLARKKILLEYAQEDLKGKRQEANKISVILEKIRQFIGKFSMFAPLIEEYAISVEKNKKIEAGNSFRGILYELGELLERFKEIIKAGLCWFPRLMRWNTSVGEVAPVFKDTDDGYSYSICGYMNVKTKEQYPKESLQSEIAPEVRVGTVEQLDANVAALESDLKEILRMNGGQKLDDYEEWGGNYL